MLILNNTNNVMVKIKKKVKYKNILKNN